MGWIYRVGVQEYLTQAEMENNADIVYDFVINHWNGTVEACCGLLGNMQAESGLNPGNEQTGSISDGYGLIQWTPANNLIDWCTDRGYQWFDGNAQMLMIEWEGSNGVGYYPTEQYPYTWSEYLQLTNVRTCALAYHDNRERSADTPEMKERRVTYANEWYEYFERHPPTPPTPPTPTRRRRSIIPIIANKKGYFGLRL